MTNNEADELLRSAIVTHAQSYGMLRDGELLSEFAVIAYWNQVDDNGEDHYTTHYHIQAIPNHLAMGLFSVGVDIAGMEDD